MVKKVKDSRLYLRLNSDLKERMEGWAHRHDTTLSQVVTRFFENLLEHESKETKAKEKQAAEKFF